MLWELAQVNIARMVAPLDDPVMADFVDNIQRINALGEQSPGFVWIMAEGEDHGGNLDVRFYDDPELISNVTVWTDVASLMAYVLQTEHIEFLRRRREWFTPEPEAALALWWVPAGHRPTLAEAEERLTLLRERGPSNEAFTPRDPFPAPAA